MRLRGDPPPDDTVLVVRGGERSLADDNLTKAAGIARARFGFWAISVFAAPEGDLVALCQQVDAIRRRPAVRLATCGDLRRAGFPIFDTTRHPLHFSIVLAELTTRTFDRLRGRFGEPVTNPGYRP